MMMHQFSVSTLVAAVRLGAEAVGVDPALLRSIAGGRMLLSSAFAEGKTGQDILRPTMTAVPVDGGYRINGVKKPCSLSGSMDLMTASVAVAGMDGLGIALVPANADGLSVHPFWTSFALAGAQSDEVRLENVFVPTDQVVLPPLELSFLLQMTGLIHFQLYVCAAYTGIASSLVHRVLAEGRGSVTDRADLVVGVESAALATESVAHRLIADDPVHTTLAAAQVARFAAQDAVGRTVNRAVELLGGMAYVSSSDVGYLAVAAHGIAFHPPSRTSAAQGVVDYFTA
jgi:alkylation response protein AidB-like acyl-CoA dehydrogenase